MGFGRSFHVASLSLHPSCLSCSPSSCKLCCHDGLPTRPQVHIFIFVMALFHILVGIGLIVVSSFRMRRWRAWTEQDDPQAHSTLCDDPPTINFRY